MNLASRLERALPKRQLSLIRLIVDEASRRGLTLYAAGGLPRDLLLNRLVRDLDLVVEGDALPLAWALSRAHGGRVTTHPTFHTATWTLPPHLAHDTGILDTLDLISSRSETYKHPAALPTVKLGNINDDLLRRDFTVNAMALRLDASRFGELIDPLGGQDDLQKKTIRVLHPRSFMDDPTRLFRAVRYAGRLGFTLDPETESLIPGALKYVDKLSPERLRHELNLILDEEDPVSMLERLWELGISGTTRPALPSGEAMWARVGWMSRLPANVEERRETRWMLWLMSSSTGEIDALDKRLGFAVDLSKKIRAAAAVWSGLDSFAALRPSECTRRLDKFPAPAIRAASICAPRGEARSALETYLAKWRDVKPFTDGDTLLKMGIPFGPRIGQILRELRAAWLDGAISSKQEEEQLVEKLVRARQN